MFETRPPHTIIPVFAAIIPAILLIIAAAHGAEPTKSPISLDLKNEERARVLAAADHFLTLAPVTITSYPAKRSAGGLHDYFSEADYWWPDPANPDGPYISRDGMTNPDNFNDHREALFRLGELIPALVSAYEITGDTKYSKHAVEHLKAWFVDPATKMNPSLPYAQAVHNKFTGRSFGVIDTLHLVEVAQAIVVLHQHHAIDPQDDAPITTWFADYIKWMTTHPNGVTEGNAHNNHATCYWEQIAAFATLTGDQAMLAEARQRYKTQLLNQMATDGSFPAELARTKPYGYSMFVLDQMVILCQILSTPTDNLWTYSMPDGRTIRKGVEFMYPYVKDKSTWPHKPDVMFYEFWPVRSMTWLFADMAFQEPKYLDLWKTLQPDPTNAEILRNVPVRYPLVWFQQN